MNIELKIDESISYRTMNRLTKTHELLSELILVLLFFVTFADFYKPPICETEICRDTATKMKIFMDKSINPCHDFYGFVCGNFSKNAELKESSQIDIFSYMQNKVLLHLKEGIEKITKNDPEAFQKLKSYYDICINEDRIDRTGKDMLKQLFKELGGWPVLENSWNDTNFKWPKLIIESRRKGLFYDSFIDLSIAPDLKNNSRRLVTIGEPKFGIPIEIFKNESHAYKQHTYLALMMMVVEILGIGFSKSYSDLYRILYLKISLAKISLDPVEKQELKTKPLDLMTISELQNEFPYISWLEYINNILAPYKTLKPNDVINVEGRKYFKELGNLLKKYSNRELANYVFWCMTEHLINALSKEAYKSQEYVQKSILNKLMAAQSPRWVACVTYANNFMSLATGALYIRKYFDHSKKESVMNIVVDVLNSFKQILDQVDWMDETTRAEAKEKLEHMIPLIAYPNELLNDEKLNSYYEDLKIDTSSFLQTELNINLFSLKKTIEQLDMPVNKSDWSGIYGAAAAVVNAFNIPNSNVIQFPAAILQHPFYIPNNLNYMNYAGLGYVIGHEITHGFDNRGKQFDKNGNLRNWWDPETEKKFLSKIECIINQYNNYTYKELNVSLNGKSSLGENIADNGGLKMAYSAYNRRLYENFKRARKGYEEPRLSGFEEYSNKQMFWIAYAHLSCVKYKLEKVNEQILFDPHVPTEYRVIGTISNSNAFAVDFECPEGSPMNPIVKCHVW